jgi:hypothetical protein
VVVIATTDAIARSADNAPHVEALRPALDDGDNEEDDSVVDDEEELWMGVPIASLNGPGVEPSF